MLQAEIYLIMILANPKLTLNVKFNCLMSFNEIEFSLRVFNEIKNSCFNAVIAAVAVRFVEKLC